MPIMQREASAPLFSGYVCSSKPNSIGADPVLAFEQYLLSPLSKISV